MNKDKVKITYHKAKTRMLTGEEMKALNIPTIDEYIKKL